MVKRRELLGLGLLFVLGACDSSSSSAPDDPPGPEWEADSPEDNSGAPGVSSPPSSSEDGGEEEPLPSLSYGLFFKSFVDQSLLPRLDHLERKSRELKEAFLSCDLESAQPLWQEVMAQWQVVEVFQVGPIRERRFEARERIYSYPRNVPCFVDRAMVQLANGESLPLGSQARGLGAIEYLLFKGDWDQHACLPNDRTMSEWDQYASVRSELHCQLGAKLSLDIEDQARKLAESFQAPSFQDRLIHADDHPRELLGEFIHAALYLDRVSKDIKLGSPTGLSAQSLCREEACPYLVEHPFSKSSRVSLQANVQGLAEFYLGREDQPGLYDLLSSEGEGDPEVFLTLKETIEALSLRLDQEESLYAGVEKIKGQKDQCLKSTVGERFVEVCALYREFQNLTNQIKRDLVQTLGVNLPTGAGGDAD